MPDDVRAMAEGVLARLSLPVRIAVMGRCDTDLAAVANGLLDGPVVPERAGLPPVELAFSLDDSIGIITGDGRRESIDRRTLEFIDLRALAKVDIATPLPLLEQVRFLVVPLDPDDVDINAAVAWTARRADMLVWSATGLIEAEVELWRCLPETLQDHGFLVLTGPADATGNLPRPYEPTAARFRSVHRLGEGPARVASFRKLRVALLDHVAAARWQDLDGALALLERYLPSLEARKTAEEASADVGVPDFSDLLDVPAPVQGVNAVARSSAATEIIDFLSAQVEELAELCGVADSVAPNTESHTNLRKVLGLCSESIAACGELASVEGGVLADVLAEASDLMLLMQLEATPPAMDDAVALLLQVRHECEARLCA